MPLTENEKPTFRSIARRFDGNLRALRIFNERIGEAAAEHDRSAVQRFNETVQSLLPEGHSLEDLKQQDKAIAEQSAVGDADATTITQQDAREAIRSELRTPQKFAALVQAVISFSKASPVQEDLLRTSVLISLMSYLETLIADLIHAYYLRYPESLPAEERMLSLAELRRFSSIQEAEAYLVSKEVDSVLRESLDSQLTYFVKRFKVKLDEIELYRPVTVEADQRRNIYVHNRGIVNRAYLEKVEKELAKLYDARADERLSIDRDYLKEVLETVEVFGIVLVQQCWRKWGKDEVSSADDFMLEATYEALKEERYTIVARLAEYAGHVEFESDDRKRRICINHAIALRDSNQAGVDEVLSKNDWSACGLNFQVALSAVRGEEDRFFELLPRAVASRELKKEDLEEWPVFKNMRQTERFTNAIDELYSSGQIDP